MFRAGDVVAHAPTGEEWVLACDEFGGGYVMAIGWPETLAYASDCTLIKAASDDERIATLEMVSKSTGLRASRARERLDAARKGGAT